MRSLVLACAVVIGCAKPQPVQDPLDYLRIGVNPREEANAIIEDLRNRGFTFGRRIEERGYVAFDAKRGPDSTVRIVTSRGPSLSIQVPDVRWLQWLWVELAPDPRPDFNRDGQRDAVLAIREPGRTCLVWAQVDPDGFVLEVFRPSPDWGDSPCVIEIDPSWPRLLLEVTVPHAPTPHARVRRRGAGRLMNRLPPSPNGSDRSRHENGLSRKQKREMIRCQPLAWKWSSTGSNGFAKAKRPC